MGTDTRRRGDWGPSWLPWWLMWAFILFWPLCFGLAVVEAAWLVLLGIIALLAWTGRREVRRRP